MTADLCSSGPDRAFLGGEDVQQCVGFWGKTIWKVSAATAENQFKGFGPCLDVTVLETAAPGGGS